MAHMQYLIFDGEEIPKPVSYDVSMTDVEADSSGVTEAGTTQRDVVRAGVVEISLMFQVSEKWLKKLTRYKQQESIRVFYFDPETAELKQAQMYVDGFQARLERDTSYKGLWTVGFVLKEF